MILKNYPGHILAGISILICIAALIWAYRTVNLNRLKMKRWGLALLTLLPMLILLWILWEPSKLTMIPQTRPCTVQVFFDTSQSMSIQDVYQKSRLDAAVDLFNKQFQSNDAGSPRFQLFGFDQSCYPVNSLESLSANGRKSNLSIPWERACAHSMMSKDSTVNSVSGSIIFTDGQADIQNLNTYTTLQDEDYPVLLVPLGSDLKQPDIIVTDLVTPLQTAVNTRYAASASITAYRLKEKPITVEVLQNNRVIISKNLVPETLNYSTTIDFDLGAPSTGLDKIEVIAKTEAFDEFYTDNNHKIKLVKTIASQKRRVLLYSQVACLDMGKIRQALNKDQKVQLDFRLDAIIDPAIVRDNPDFSKNVKFPAESSQLNEYDILILGPMDFNALSDTTISNLYDFVADRGGTVVFLPGKSPFTLPDVQVETIQAMLPVIFKPQSSRPNETASLLPVATTSEGKATALVSSLDSASNTQAVIPAYLNVVKKPAASTLLGTDDIPLLCLHRLGRGYVSFLNSHTLFRLYKSDPDDCFLQEMLSSLIAYSSRFSAEESHVDLAALIDHQQNRVVFESYVRDMNYKPVSGANVILDVDGEMVKMQPGASEGRYIAALENLDGRSVYATAKAEYGGVFLGQKTIITDLPERHDEMSRTNANKPFLSDLAEHTHAKCLEPSQINENTVTLFKSSVTVEQKSQSQPAWHRWSLLLLLCGILTLNWFVRRSLGIV